MPTVKLKLADLNIGQLGVKNAHVLVTSLKLNVDGTEFEIIYLPLFISVGEQLSIALVKTLE